MSKFNFRAVVLIVCLIGLALSIALMAEVARQGHEKPPVDTNAVELVTLKDGTKCAIWTGHRAGGISCNWKGE